MDDNVSRGPYPTSIRTIGATSDAIPPTRNPIRKQLEKAKREAVEDQIGKGESWCTKVLNGDMGVKLDDIPGLCAALGLKIVSTDKRCVDADVYDAVLKIHERLAPHVRRLVWDDAE